MSSLLDEIKALKSKALALDPDASSRKRWLDGVSRITEDFLSKLDAEKGYNEDHSNIYSLGHSFDGEGQNEEEVFNEIVRTVDSSGINPASGKHLGYIPGGGLYASALGDFWADITNRYAGIFFANPGAVKIENELIRWMIELTGYPDEAWGNLTSGGSIANLIAIVTAREEKRITPENVRKATVYMSPQTHHCVPKALRIAGLQQAQTRIVELDDKLRMDPGNLAEQVGKDVEEGLLPFLLVSSIGTTDAGVIDPVDELDQVCKQHNMWHHTDSAYGGFFLLSRYHKEKLSFINLTDSLVLDPHKGLFIPYGLGVVLVKDRRHLTNAFSYEASYMQDATEDDLEISPADVSPELTKHFRGLRLWLPLKLHGLEAFKAAIEEKYLLAQYFHERILELEGFEVFDEPELSVVMFRYVTKDPSASNRFNMKLIKEIHHDGRMFLSSTSVEGVFWLRVAILAFRTHIETMELALDVIREKVEEIKVHNEALLP